MKKIISVLLSIVMVLSMTTVITYAEEPTIIASGVWGKGSDNQGTGTENDIVSHKFNWSIDNNGLFTFEAVDGATDIANSQNVANDPWYSNIGSIKKMVIPDGVTMVGGNLVKGATNLTEIIYPESCTTVYYGYEGCSSLENIVFPPTYEANGLVASVFNGTKIGSMVFPKTSASTEYPHSVFQGLKTVTVNGGTIKSNAHSNTTTIDKYFEWRLFGDVKLEAEAFRSNIGMINKLVVDKDIQIDNKVIRLNSQCYSSTIDVYGIAGSSAAALDGKNALNRNGVVKNTDDGKNTPITYVFHPLVAMGSEGNLAWWIDGTELTIEGKGKMLDFTSAVPAGWSQYADKIRTVKIGEGVTSIGANAFLGCDNIKTVIMPSTLTSIGAGAFTSSNLLAIELQDDVTSVATDAFAAGTKVCVRTTSTLKDTSGYYVYKDGGSYESSGLAAGSATATWKVYQTSATGECALIVGGTGQQVGYFGDERPWKEYTANISTLVVDYGVTRVGGSIFSIKNNAYDNMTSLKRVSIADSVTTIQDNAFNGVSSVEKLNLSNKLETIKGWAFNGLSGVKSIEIPGTVTTFDSAAFGGMSGLTTLELGEGLTNISGGDRWNGIFQGAGIEELVLPNGFKTLGAYVFKNCNSLKKVIVPDSIETIDGNAFGTISASETKDLTLYASASNTVAANFYNEFKDYGVKLVAHIASGDVNESITWKIDSDYKLYIDGTGEMPDYTSEAPAPWNEYASQITEAAVAGTITKIGANAFAGTSESFKLHCTTKTAVDYAAANGIDYVIGGILSTGIKWVIDGDTMTLSGNGAMPGNIYGENVETPWDDFGIRNLKTIIVEDGITNIPGRVFNIATALKTIILSDDAEYIGNGALNESDNLEFIEIPASITNIGGFATTTELKRVAFLSETANIDTGVGRGRSNEMTYYVVAGSAAANQNITDARIKKETIKANGKIAGTSIEWLVTNEGTLEVYGVGDLALVDTAPWAGYVTDIENVYIEEGITGVGANLFNGINGYIELPNSVTSLGANAFAGCASDIRVPYEVKNIDTAAFDANSKILCYQNSYALQFAEDNIKNHEVRNGLRILVIGNSYSEDIAINHLWDVATKMGIEEVKIGNLMYPGRNIINVYNHIKNDDHDYIYREITSGGRTVDLYKGNANIRDGIIADDWDVITIQPWFPDATYGLNGIDDGVDDGAEWLNFVADYIRANATNDNMKLAFNMIWSQNQKFSGINRVGNQNYNLYSNNRPNYGNEMYDYNNIVNQTETHVFDNPKFDYILPTGTAIQNARTSYLGGLKGTTSKYNMIGGMQRDLTHIANIGMYIGAMTWVKTLFPALSIDDMTWAPNVTYASGDLNGKTIFDEDVIETAKWAANAACTTPLKVTQSDKPFRIMSYKDGNITIATSNVVRTLGYADEAMTVVDDQKETGSQNGTYKDINDQEAVVIIAEYDPDNKLVKCKSVNHTLTYDETYGVPSESTTYSTSVVSDGDFNATEGNKIKVMMFDNFNNIKPLCEVFEK